VTIQSGWAIWTSLLNRSTRPLAAWQLAVDVLRRAGEPDQVDEAGVVRGADLQRRADLGRGDHAVDQHVEHAELALDGVGGGGAAAHDHAAGGQEQQVAHQRPGQFLHQRRDARPHPLQAGDLREQGKENLRPHATQHSWRKRPWNAICTSLLRYRALRCLSAERQSPNRPGKEPCGRYERASG